MERIEDIKDRGLRTRQAFFGDQRGKEGQVEDGRERRKRKEKSEGGKVIEKPKENYNNFQE